MSTTNAAAVAAAAITAAFTVATAIAPPASLQCCVNVDRIDAELGLPEQTAKLLRSTDKH
ncbi:hypothetical protein JF780_07750 [Mycobacterium intracellulare]|uniref:hypothetical protein n=1 Tax=Mycobacterium intracellulare TaxID=1767 RepID=UPI001CD9AA6F|nr:hypothetical protein [Mycobacterium intracellulare]MCA2272417.1 hypothetical protein [Mycobacterium intracellulare]MCA2324845.1 hypothetical protein [Mycobacterium intracellulare]